MFRWTLNDLDSNVIYVLRKDGKYSDPKGYEGLVLTHERDERYHGISYDFTTELGFFCKGGGKELLDAAYNLKSQEANVRIKLEVKCNGTFTTMLDGKLNFASYRQEWVAGVLYTFMDAEKDDIKIKLANREDMEVDLLTGTSLDGVALNNYPYLNYDINLHSRVIFLESDWIGSNHGCCTNVSDTLMQAFINPVLSLNIGNFTQSNPTASTCQVIAGSATIPNYSTAMPPIISIPSDSEIFTQQNTATVTWAFTGVMELRQQDYVALTDCELPECSDDKINDPPSLVSLYGASLRLYFGQGFSEASENCEGASLESLGLQYIDLIDIPGKLWASATPIDLTAFTGSGVETIPLNQGDKVWLYWRFYSTHASGINYRIRFTYDEATINIQSDTVSEESTCKGIAIHEAWSRLCERITDQNLAFYSEFFGRTDSNISYASDGCGSKTAITSGKKIRALDAPIKPSLKSMFDSCNAVYGIGLGIEKYQGVDVVRCEEVDYFYSDTEVLRLSNIPNIQMRHLGEKVYNEINLGFAKWETNSATGLDEPLTRINYVVPPIKNNKNKFEAISQFVAGMYAIELTRRSQTETKKDTSYDEDIFFLCLSDNDLTVCEKDEKFTSISGLISPETAYNLRFLLSMTFDRLKNQFVSGLTKLGTLLNPVVMPAEAEGNDDVQYQYVDGCAGDGFGSNQSNGRAGRYPHAYARRDNPIWLPEEYTFDYPLEFDKYINLVSNPYGLIYFSENDTNFKSGWLMNLEYNVRNKTGTFTLLRRYQ